MQPDTNNPSVLGNAGSASLPLSASEPPVINAPPLGVPPLPSPQSDAWRKLLAFLLSLCLGLFLIDAVVSLLDDSLILFFDLRILTMIRGMVFLFAMLGLVVTYALMGLTPMIPKRLFLPLALFILAAQLALIPVLIYRHDWLPRVALVISICQVAFGLGIACWLQGGFKLRWPLVPENQLEGRRFSWRNLSVFVLANVFVLLPGVVVYLSACAALAVDHLSEGFMALRRDGLTVQSRKYVRDDGKVIRLFPMSHVAERDFYRELSQAFTSNSIILMEGVTDDRNLLTNKISYKRMATTLGVAEQQKEFRPIQGEMVRADVDVGQFSSNTIGFLNLVMLPHSKGLNAEVILKLIQYSPPPNFEKQLIDDLLGKRNRHLVEEIRSRLVEAELIVVPWGVAHMPEIAREIQKSGFRLDETREYTVFRFGSARDRNQGEEQGENHERSE